MYNKRNAAFALSVAAVVSLLALELALGRHLLVGEAQRLWRQLLDQLFPACDPRRERLHLAEREVAGRSGGGEGGDPDRRERRDRLVAGQRRHYAPISTRRMLAPRAFRRS